MRSSRRIQTLQSYLWFEIHRLDGFRLHQLLSNTLRDNLRDVSVRGNLQSEASILLELSSRGWFAWVAWAQMLNPIYVL